MRFENQPLVSWSREALAELVGRHMYGGAEQYRAVADQLRVGRRGGFQVPDKVLVILFPSRSGSSFLGQLLSSTGWFREIQESFRPEQLAKIKERYRLPDVHAAAQWMIDHRGTEHAFGFKAGFRVLAAAVELGVLPKVLDRSTLVLLRRRDRVSQAISLFKSKLTRRTHSAQPDTRRLTDDDYDHKAIAAELASIRIAEDTLAAFAEELGRPAPILFYEDVCERPFEHVEKVCAMMGLPVPSDYSPRLKTTVLRDELSQRWAERFQSERAEV